MREISTAEVEQHVKAVRIALRDVESALQQRDAEAIYAAAERCQHAAFDLKSLMAPRAIGNV